MGSIVKINNQTYTGNNIVISNNKVMIDGKDCTPDSKSINVMVEGNIDGLSVGSCEKISVIGDVNKLSSVSGDIELTGSVNGDVLSTSGDIEIGGSVEGSVRTNSGDVKCKKVSGSVSTNSGDIKKTLL